MLSAKLSPASSSTAAPSAATTTARSGSSSEKRRSLLLDTQAHLLRAGEPEEPGRADDQDEDEDREPHCLLQRRVEIEPGERFGDADQEAADIGAPDAAEAAEDHDGEGGE